MKILVVEDDDDIRTLISFNLEKEGHEIKEAKDGKEAIALFDSGTYQAVLIDILIPEVRGTDVLKHIRSVDGGKSTVLMVSALEDDQEIIDALENGADDYITKPFSPRILIARIRAQLRGRNQEDTKADSLEYIGIKLDRTFHEVLIDGKPATLTANEFSILDLFMSSPGRVFSRDAIITALHGDGYPVTDRAVDVSIVNLRKKLGDKAAYIETVRGVGYKMKKI